MPSGIFGATVTNLVAGTTIVAADVLASLNSLKANGLNNDGATIQTDGSGNIVTPAGRLNHLGIITPYHLTTNPTVNNGNTTTLTCTGVGGIPSGAIAVLLQVGIFSVTAQGGSVSIYPTGATPGQYANFTAAGPTNTYCMGVVIAPLSAGGQITVKASGANIVLQDWYIYGYFI